MIEPTNFKLIVIKNNMLELNLKKVSKAHIIDIQNDINIINRLLYLLKKHCQKIFLSSPKKIALIEAKNILITEFNNRADVIPGSFIAKKLNLNSKGIYLQ